MSEQHQAEPGENAKAGPTVGEDVLAVGFKDEGVGAAASANEVVAKSRIDDASDQDENNT